MSVLYFPGSSNGACHKSSALSTGGFVDKGFHMPPDMCQVWRSRKLMYHHGWSIVNQMLHSNIYVKQGSNGLGLHRADTILKDASQWKRVRCPVILLTLIPKISSICTFRWSGNDPLQCPYVYHKKCLCSPRMVARNIENTLSHEIRLIYEQLGSWETEICSSFL